MAIRSRTAALKVAMADRTNTPGMCQSVTRGWFNAPAVGDVDGDNSPDAEDGWKSEPASARHLGDRKPPTGVPLYFEGGSHDNGHRCMTRNATGGVRSTDMKDGKYTKGVVGNATIDQIEKSMGVRYVGWSETISGKKIPGVIVKKPTDNPSTTGSSKPKPSTGKLPTDAIDGSHWNVFTVPGMRTASKDGVELYWFKATEGTDFVDEKYVDNRAMAKTAGKKSGAYHFARPRQSGGAKQAEFFLAHAKIKPGTDLMIMLDLEDNGGLSRTALTKWVGDFMRVIFTHLGKVQLIYTNFDLNDNFGCLLWVARYHNGNALPDIPSPWKEKGELWTIRQFSNGVFGNPKSVRGIKKVDLNNVVGELKRVYLPPLKNAPKPKPSPAPKTPKGAIDFRIHLNPGNKKQSVASIVEDMGLVKKTSGDSAIDWSTEREKPEQRTAVSTGLGKGWTRKFTNENTMAHGPNWHQTAACTQLLLAKEDPGMDGVSPNRYLNRAPLEHKGLPGVTIKHKGTHLVSEANCIHTKVKGRKWREKTWKIQVNDVLDDCEKDYKADIAQTVSGDFNVGVKFTGKQLFKLFQDRFGEDVIHVHNGGLDQMLAISSKSVKLEEIGVETITDNNSDHNKVTATLRAYKR